MSVMRWTSPGETTCDAGRQDKVATANGRLDGNDEHHTTRVYRLLGLARSFVVGQVAVTGTTGVY